MFFPTCMHFHCKQTGCRFTSHNILCVVLLMYCMFGAAAGFLMRMHGPRCRLPSSCPASEMHTISLTVLAIVLWLSLLPSATPLLSVSFFPLDLFCIFLPLLKSLFLSHWLSLTFSLPLALSHTVHTLYTHTCVGSHC